MSLDTVTCQFCGCDLDDNVVLCRDCATPHHEDCFRCNGICTTYACGCTSFVLENSKELIELPKMALPEARKTAKAKLGKLLATPGHIPIEHSFESEINQHIFKYDDETEVAYSVVVVVILYSFISLLMLFLTLEKSLLFMPLILLALWCIWNEATTGGKATLATKAELQIDSLYIKYTAENNDMVDIFRGSIETRYLCTVAINQVKSVEIRKSVALGYPYMIRIKAPQKVKKIDIEGGPIEYVDHIDVYTLMDKERMQWLLHVIKCLIQINTDKV